MGRRAEGAREAQAKPVLVSLAFGAVLCSIAALSFYRAIVGYRRGKADWHAGRGLSLSAEREDDPVGFATAVWGNVLMGAFVLWMAAWIAFD